MIALIQRVTEAAVEVDGRIIAQTGPGLLALVAVVAADTPAQGERLLDRLLGYRVFPDESGRMNLSLADTGGGLLLVPQFTLAADTHKGMRPSFGPAAASGQGQALFEDLVGRARGRHGPVAAGAFGAHMRVSLVNDGPVTFWLEAKPTAARTRSRGTN
jgi:D-tyrosyl-tRNA(Tyr) deacylase